MSIMTKKSIDCTLREVTPTQRWTGCVWSPVPSFGSCSHGKKTFSFRIRIIKIERRLKDRVIDQERKEVWLYLSCRRKKGRGIL